MKKSILISIIFVIAFGCNKQNGNGCEDYFFCVDCDNLSMGNPSIEYNCFVASFLEAASCYSKCSNTFIIKGILLEYPYKNACNVRFVEDIKGNFPENVSTFTIWSMGTNYSLPNFFGTDPKQNVLVFLLCKSPEFPQWSNPDLQWFEKPEDFRTLLCTSSVLELSDDKVIGHILPNCGNIRTENMSWKDFQKRLNKLLT